MKKLTTYTFAIALLLFYTPFLSAQVNLVLVVSQTPDNAIELNWSLLGGAQEDWEFQLDRSDVDGTWSSIATIPSEGFSVENYTHIDYGPFVNGSYYTYRLHLNDGQGNIASDSVFAWIQLIENPYFFKGKVGYDEDESCTLETGETLLYGKTIEATNGTDVYYGSTNNLGEYHFVVPGDDTYTVSLIENHPYSESCIPPTTVVAGSSGTSTIDFPIQSLIDCPYLTVDIAVLGLRRCMTNHIGVSYQNNGTITSDDPYIEVTLDPFLTVTSSSIPWTSFNNNTYTFELDPLEVGDYGNIWLEADLDCDVELGQTHCSTAHIFPDSICTPPSTAWDGSSISLSAECVNDEVVFTIQNVGDMNMTEALDYVIIQDNVMLSTGDFQLDAGQQTVESFVATGSTFRMEADQAIGHPGFSMPAIAIEGCGGINPGFVTLFAEDDGDSFISIDCQENVDSYDPNDKQGFPKGYGEPNYIHTGQDLEYLIRFQNTGTAPAINVIIVDTLDKNLDFASLQPGASSHPYRFEYFGDGAVQFIFENINLPDSTANEPESHGFVKFDIRQQPDLPLETEVFNQAAIYFDFNPPVLTNATRHTVGEEFVTVSIDNPIVPLLHTKVYPNPFIDKAVFEIEGLNSTTTNFKLYNALGHLIKEETFSGNRYEFERGLLPTGFYLFEVLNDGQKVSSGKVVIK